ncbi:MAG: nickel pincer cofactor biosynthesis protein LarC [Gemmatimonadales bacterium]
MSHSRFAIIDPAAGISGDMLMGALVAAGASPEWLAGVPERLGLHGVAVEIETVKRCGVEAVKVTVRLPGGESEGPHDAHQDNDHFHHHGPQQPGHGHEHGRGPHRHVGELIAVLERAPLSTWVRDRAIGALRLVAEAEGRIHGVPAEAVALHEVGAVDALVDIVAGIEGFEQLGIDRIFNRPIAVGNGWIRAAHGVLPVPAPVTTLVLEGLEIGPNGPVTGEATTPTGAALLRVLSTGHPPARWRGVSSGWGAGSRNPEDYPNALRLTLAEAVTEAAQVVTLVTDLDDLSPEYLEPLREALFAAGALDVQLWGTQMKKGRAGFRIETLADPVRAEEVAAALFRHSTTAGVRRWTADRVTLPRREIEVEASAGVTVRVKIFDAPGGPKAKPEYDDIHAAARRLGRPAYEVARAVEARAQSLLAGVSPAETQTKKREP